MTWSDMVGTALARIAEDTVQVGEGRWSFAVVDGTYRKASARIEDGWLMLGATLGGAVFGGGEWTLLEWNADLAGGARIALRPARHDLGVRAEIALEAGVDVERRILEAHAGLSEASSRMHYHAAAKRVATSRPPVAVTDATEDLAALCRDSGWVARARDAGRLDVDLDVPGAVHQAVVERRADGAVVMATPILDTALTGVQAASVTCRRALALLLLRTCGAVRIVRAVATVDDAVPARLEVVHRRPTVPELGDAFAALSIACRLAAAEAAVLWHDETAASSYLRHWDDARGTVD